MAPNQQTVVLGVLNPDLADCPDARVELLFRGQVVDRRTVSSEPSRPFQGGYRIGRLRPRGSLSPTIGRRYAAGPTGVSFEVVFAGTVGGVAWWGAEESGSYEPPPASSFEVDALRFDVSAVRAAALLKSIVTASGSDGMMRLR